jgi:drug/metabolite transporter (DMT)-like permease
MLARRSTAAPLLAYLCLASSMALVGAYVGLSRWLVAVLPVVLLAWLRFGIAALAMAHWVRRQAGDAPLSATDRRLLFLESLLGNVGFSVCMLYGVSLTSAVSAGVVMAGIPAAVALLSWAALGERIAPRVLAAIACAVAGIATLALARTAPAAAAVGGASAPPAWHGLAGHALLVGAVFCEASYVVIGKRLTGAVSPRRISALINLWGLALVTPLGLWQAWSFNFSAVPLPTWGLLAGYAIAASMVTVWLWMKGLQQVPAQRAGVFTVLLPVSAALVGVLFLGEGFSAAHGLAFALALAGLLLATWPARRVSAVPR